MFSRPVFSLEFSKVFLNHLNNFRNKIHTMYYILVIFTYLFKSIRVFKGKIIFFPLKHVHGLFNFWFVYFFLVCLFSSFWFVGLFMFLFLFLCKARHSTVKFEILNFILFSYLRSLSRMLILQKSLESKNIYK